MRSRTRSMRGEHCQIDAGPFNRMCGSFPLASLGAVQRFGRFREGLCCKTRLLFAAGPDLSIGQLVAFSAESV